MCTNCNDHKVQPFHTLPPLCLRTLIVSVPTLVRRLASFWREQPQGRTVNFKDQITKRYSNLYFGRRDSVIHNLKMNRSILVSVLGSLCLSHTEGERYSGKRRRLHHYVHQTYLNYGLLCTHVTPLTLAYGIKSLKHNLNTIRQILYQPVVLAFDKAVTFCHEHAIFFELRVLVFDLRPVGLHELRKFVVII